MDLREKISLPQKLAEYSIRFRLVEVIIAFVLCVIALFNIDGVLAGLLPLSVQAENFIMNFNPAMLNTTIISLAVAMFLFRAWFFGFKCGLLWFFFLFFNAMALLALGECKDFMQIALVGILIFAITGFFFIRSLLVKTMLPLIFLAYTMSSWLLFLGISNLAWFGLLCIFFADTYHMIFVISYQIKDAKNKKTLGGAIVHGVKKTIPVSLFSIGVLIILDTVFYFLKMPLIASNNLALSIAIYICYFIWMPFFTAAVLSFCPLENTWKKMQKKSK
jgi:hypothetical protein